MPPTCRWAGCVAFFRRRQTHPQLPPEAPIYTASWHHHAADLPTDLLLQRRLPRHKLEPEPIIDHGEPTRREGDALAIGTGDVIPFGDRAMRESGLERESRVSPIQLPPPQCLEQIAGEDDTLALPPRQTFLNEVIDTTDYRLAYFGAESATARRRLPRNKLSIDPGSTECRCTRWTGHSFSRCATQRSCRSTEPGLQIMQLRF